MCVIPVVVIGVRVLCWVKRRGRKKTHRITSQSADKEVSYHYVTVTGGGGGREGGTVFCAYHIVWKSCFLPLPRWE